MIVITGAAGFIGSCLMAALNAEGFRNLIAVDDFSRSDKLRNLENKQIAGMVHREQFLDWLRAHHKRVNYIFHLGARTDTTESDRSIFDRLNVAYSKSIWEICCDHVIPMLYASSAATYGDGSNGYTDSDDVIAHLKPLNPYGDSKNDFDKWVLQQQRRPPHWVGLKFFNVYGPNENHKGRMASVIYHAFHQIRKTGAMKLFRSHRADVADGQQSRDFIYVKDIVSICLYCQQRRPSNGIYNAGTGQARSFLDLVTHTFEAMNLTPKIEFIDTPMDIRDTYQYYTEASMDKWRAQGYQKPFVDLSSGVTDYVRSYLIPGLIW